MYKVFYHKSLFSVFVCEFQSINYFALFVYSSLASENPERSNKELFMRLCHYTVERQKSRELSRPNIEWLKEAM